MRNPLNILFAALGIAAVVILSACAGTSSATLAQIQQAGQTFVTTVKTDVALYESQHSVSAADQANITIALNALSAANVVLQGLTTSTTATSYIQAADSVVSAAVSVIDSLPSGTLSPDTVNEINSAAALFQLAAGLAQTLIATPAPASNSTSTPAVGAATGPL